MHWPLVYLPDERLSFAELSAARLDGDVVEIGDGYMPADAIESVSMRAASMRGICGSRLVAGLWSAAWIYGALLEPPSRHAVMRGAAHRVGNLIDRRAVFHDVGVHDSDVLEMAGVRVTSPLRTFVDVARRLHEPAHRERAQAVMSALVTTGSVSPEEALVRLEANGRMPGIRQARTVLRQHTASATEASVGNVPLSPS